MTAVPASRLRAANDRPVRPDGAYVLYWITGARRVGWNFGLQQAVGHAAALNRPLVVVETLKAELPWGSARIHAAIMGGMADLSGAFAEAGVTYHPFVEPRPGEAEALLAGLAAEACVVVMDDFPCYVVPGAIAWAAARFPVRVEAVDSNGLLPMRAAPKAFARAVDFRRFLQKTLGEHLGAFPLADPLAGVALAPGRVPAALAERHPATPLARLRRFRPEEWPVDGGVAPVAGFAPGEAAGAARLRHFVAAKLGAYPESRNEPDADGASGLSPYLHFGFVSAHAAVASVLDREGWHPGLLGRPDGGKAGWWGASAAAEAFLDQIVTWRELGFNGAVHLPGYDTYAALPAWARQTLTEHAHDPRPSLYDAATLDAAETHDAIWNAAQRELVREGRINNYLRMLWGKKILEWSRTPEQALEVMITLNNRYALDGRDPNSYSGIFWCLGRYDRAWGPERPIFGKIRYMSSENTRRKLALTRYLARYGPT